MNCALRTLSFKRADTPAGEPVRGILSGNMVAVIHVAGDSPVDLNVVLGAASDTLQLLRQESDSQ